MSSIAIVLFSEAAQAEPLKSRLIDSGVSASVHDALRLEKLWFVSKKETGAHIEVPSNQFERACQLLQEWNRQEGGLGAAITCPHCSSFRVEYPQFTRKSFIPNVLLGLTASVGILEKDYYCQDCHYTWPKNPAQREHTRPHSAPSYFIEGIEAARREAEAKKPKTRHWMSLRRMVGL